MKKLSALLVAGVMVASLSQAAFADTERGEFTENNPVLAHTVTLPLRLITGTFGATAGFFGGAAKGVVTGFHDADDWAHDIHSDDEGDAAEATTRNLMYFPTQAVGTAAYVPLNVLTESTKGFADFGVRGYNWWNRL